MKIGILETGRPPGDLAERFGRYDEMFRRLLGARHETVTFRVYKGEWPAPGVVFDAWLVTGSPAAAYDADPWIADLLAFLRAAKGKAKLVGVCFGHQVMAEAFGGTVVKSPKGWGVGLHRYEVVDRADWMDETAEIFVPASHQDQVVEQPPMSRVVATSAFTPFAGLAYTDQPAISFQFHPEFEPGYAQALLVERRGSVPPELADTAIASLDAPNDNARVAHWIANFLEGVPAPHRWPGPIGSDG